MSIRHAYKRWRLVNKAKTLKEKCNQISNIEDHITEIQKPKSKFALVQKKKEFTEFIEIVEKLKPVHVCDIGTSGGGTIKMFSQFAADNAKFLSIDIANTLLRQAAYPHLLKGEQKIKMINGSSSAAETIAEVKAWLDGGAIDLLFIDGDHEYEGVKKDFELYSPFVRKGGIIGFHDVNEDYRTRYGKETDIWSGEVPQLWREIKMKDFATKEIIEDADQDGYGIGVIEW